MSRSGLGILMQNCMCLALLLFCESCCIHAILFGWAGIPRETMSLKDELFMYVQGRYAR